ncbi:MAG: RNA-binding protein [Acidimicrobiia bacterium]|nr:RNA-binding protein [Acidimicrobiia bacterium]
MARLVVDGMNVIGSRPDGWWRDRDGAVRRLLGDLQGLARADHDAVTLVLDGRPLPDVPEGPHDGVEVVYARRSGRNAADDRIVELVRDLDAPADVTVITSDRALAEQVRALGATVDGANSLLRCLGR